MENGMFRPVLIFFDENEEKVRKLLYNKIYELYTYRVQYVQWNCTINLRDFLI